MTERTASANLSPVLPHLEPPAREPVPHPVPLHGAAPTPAAFSPSREHATLGTLASANGLGKDFGGHRALASLDFELKAGQIVGLLGPNGAGKTTTMKLLLGLLKPTRGQAQVLGKDCTRDALEVKRRLGYVADEPTFYDFLTGAETLEFVARMRGLDPRMACPALEPLVRTLRFSDELSALVKSYSHGTKKKLALLTALIHQPTLLLLDEPTNGLDPEIAAATRDLLLRFARNGGAVLISTHLLSMADELCQELLLLHRGERVASGTPQQVRALAGVAPDASLESAFLTLTQRR